MKIGTFRLKHIQILKAITEIFSFRYTPVEMEKQKTGTFQHPFCISKLKRIIFRLHNALLLLPS